MFAGLNHIFRKKYLQTDLSGCYTTLNEIRQVERSLKHKSEEALRQFAQELKKRAKGTHSDTSLIDAYALVSIKARRRVKATR